MKDWWYKWFKLDVGLKIVIELTTERITKFLKRFHRGVPA